MPRRALLLTLGLLLLVLPGAAHGATFSPRIVGGSSTAITSVPWQVAVIVDHGGNEYLCGGSILDATHVITAGHCTYDPDTDAPFVPGEFTVFAGATMLSTPATVRAVAAVTRHPNYSPSAEANDVALLQLSAALPLGSSEQPIALATSTPAAGTPLTVSGWGTMNVVSADAPANNDPSSPDLRAATVNLVADDAPTCRPAYEALPGGSGSYVAATMLCAAAPNTDSCQGDSGGPLASQTVPPVLVGIVAFGAGCADSRFAGVYTEVAAPLIHDFIAGVLPTPSPSAPPSLTGTPRAGETLTCNPGTWTNAVSFDYEFFASPRDVRRAFSADPTYVLPDSAVNLTIGCVVRATSGSGAQQTAVANTVGPVQSRVVPPPPTTTTTPPPPPPPTDTVPPESTVISRSCTRTVCRVVVSVDDAGFSSGVRRVAVSWTTRYRVACRRAGRATTCARTRRDSTDAVAIGRGRYVAKLAHLPSGSVTTLRLVAYDKAGNRERYATSVTLRTTSRERR